MEPKIRKDLPTVSRQQFKDFLVAERRRHHHGSTLLLTALLWICFLLVIWLHGNINSVYRLRRCVLQTVTEISVPTPLPDGTDGGTISLHNTGSTADLWRWLARGLLPSLHGSSSRPGFICNFNQVIGKVQLRQERQGLGSCKVEGALADYYRGECRSTSASTASFGLGSSGDHGDALDPAFFAGGGMAGLTPADQKRFFGWLDVWSPEEGRHRAEELARGGWCDEVSSRLEARVALFNAEIQAFTLVSTSFIFEQGGLVRTDVEVSPLMANLYPQTWHIIIDIIWLLLTGALFFRTLQEASERKGQGLLGRCFSLWIMLDWAAILCGLALVGFFVFFLFKLGAFEQKVGSLGGASDPAIASANATLGMSLAYEGKLAGVLESLQELVFFKANHRLGMFWYTMLLLARLFRGFMGQPRIFLIGHTLELAAMDLLHFAILLVVAVENFVLGGCVLFGVEMADWASVSRAHRSTLAVVFGHGDFAAMYAQAPIRTTCWLVMFVVTIIFLVSNMVVAILVDHFATAKKSSGQVSQNILEQLGVTIMDTAWKVAYHFRVVHRFIYNRGGASLRKILPSPLDEPERVPVVLYDRLLEAVTEGMDGAAEAELEVTEARPADPNRPYPWSAVDKELLYSCGCDQATAEHLLQKCRACIGSRLPDDFPVEHLCFEFQSAMHGCYQQLDDTGEEFHSWLSERSVDFRNIEPRQRKLEGLSQAIEPMPAPPEPPGRPLEQEDLEQVEQRLHQLRFTATSGSEGGASSGATAPVDGPLC